MTLNNITDTSLHSILDAIRSFPEIEQAILFGSRAKGTHSPGSDIDIAIRGERCTSETALQLNAALNEKYPLPYFFDIVHYESLTNEDLLQHIDRVGRIIYPEQETAASFI